tara:strand:- start:598 stop:1206 length:609 start_codon:yes stop_codon:yes gene_type:complete
MKAKTITMNKEIDLRDVFEQMGVFEKYYENDHQFVYYQEDRDVLMQRYKKTFSHLTNLWCTGRPDGYNCPTCQEYIDILLPVFELIRLRSSRGDNLAKTDFVDISNEKDSTDERSDLFYKDEIVELENEIDDLKFSNSKLKTHWKNAIKERDDNKDEILELKEKMDKLDGLLKIEKAKNKQLLDILQGRPSKVKKVIAEKTK